MPDDVSILPLAELENGKPITTRALVRMADKLAPIPDVVFRLVELVDDPRCSAERVGRVVARDQALVANLLRLCNSGMYGASSEITDVRAAVTRVGLIAVRDMALASAVLKNTNKFGAEVVRNLREQMVTGAGCARVVASYLSQVNEAEAFLAGMLVDVGRLVFAITVPVRYGEVIAQADLAGRPIEQLEADWVGFTHAELGVEIARRWKFPVAVTYAIAHQHSLEKLNAQDVRMDLIACAAAMGATLAAVIHEELSPDHASVAALAAHPAQARLALPESVLETLLEECERARFEAAGLMSL